MQTTDRETAILDEYEQLLDAAAKRLAEARQEHESLVEIVRVLRRRLEDR
jgi:hypothetical protein